MVLAKAADAETSLIEQAQKGDRSAFGELVRHHYECLVHVAYRLCGDVQMAEDATQEALIRAWVNLPSFQPRTSLRNWLYRITINAALDALRKKPEEPIEEEAMMIADQNSGPEAVLIEKERVALLQQAMKSLPEAARSVLVLREYGELTYQEIANILDIPLGTVMSRLNYARNRLREILRDHLLQTESEYV